MNDRALLLDVDGLVPTRLGDTVLARLAGAIADGRLKPGDPMPSEASIASSFGVSKQIAREAIRELAAMGFTPYPSGSNFVLFGGVDDPHAVFEGLLERGVLIRDIGLPGTLRVTAGTETETTAFLEALAAFAPASRASR